MLPNRYGHFTIQEGPKGRFMSRVKDRTLYFASQDERFVRVTHVQGCSLVSIHDKRARRPYFSYDQRRREDAYRGRGE